MKQIIIIACISKDRGLGKGNELLWNFPEDMKFFRETTKGHPVVMGSRTFASIGRKLPGRENIVLSRHDVPGADKTCHSEAELLNYLKTLDDDIYIIGGASIYAAFVDRADKLLLTEVDEAKPADVFFPEFRQEDFRRQVLSRHEADGIKFNIVEYTRI